ncbi:TetR/AcrR family transcriptional regulator [Nonomuraea sp. KM88]|uniref:TetR/AcrR family transcriptional regulator n=1 Tax=Nonomuraea sp. KM88 TaxID=3457427 RepID=UPI003FCE3CEC
MVTYAGRLSRIFTMGAGGVLRGAVGADAADDPSLDLTRVRVRRSAALEPWDRGENEAMAALHRSAMTHEEAARAVQRLFDRQVLPVLRAALPGDPSIEAKAGLIHAQGLGMIVGRYPLRLQPPAEGTYTTVSPGPFPAPKRYNSTIWPPRSISA